MEKINIGKVCPIPKGNWDINNTYEKLNIVNKEGESYIAKENVPQYTEIENSRYWMKITEKYNLSMGQINTVSSSTQASASFTYNSTNNQYQLNLSIPRGENGILEKEIRILFIGNSLTQDGVAYLPYMLSTYYPEVNFKIYMWYIGGGSLETHYNRFINNQKADIFSVAENTPNWTNYRSTEGKTMAQVLSTYEFDIICIQPYFNYIDLLDLNDLQNCIDYIISNYKTNNLNKNGLEFITLAHAPIRSRRAEVYNRVMNGMKLMLKSTIIDDLIPVGIAVDIACDSELSSLGDARNLSPDGTHTQEGLPCLLQTYVILYWLFDKLAIPKSIYGHPMVMTTDIYNSIDVPGPNLGSGVIQGTRQQNLLAQEIAIKAYKEGKSIVLNHSSYYFGFIVSYNSEVTGLVFSETFANDSSQVNYNSGNSGLIFI